MHKKIYHPFLVFRGFLSLIKIILLLQGVENLEGLKIKIQRGGQHAGIFLNLEFKIIFLISLNKIQNIILNCRLELKWIFRHVLSFPSNFIYIPPNFHLHAIKYDLINIFFGGSRKNIYFYNLNLICNLRWIIRKNHHTITHFISFTMKEIN